jgi:hypothetical protein
MVPHAMPACADVPSGNSIAVASNNFFNIFVLRSINGFNYRSVNPSVCNVASAPFDLRSVSSQCERQHNKRDRHVGSDPPLQQVQVVFDFGGTVFVLRAFGS